MSFPGSHERESAICMSWAWLGGGPKVTNKGSCSWRVQPGRRATLANAPLISSLMRPQIQSVRQLYMGCLKFHAAASKLSSLAFAQSGHRIAYLHVARACIVYRIARATMEQLLRTRARFANSGRKVKVSQQPSQVAVTDRCEGQPAVGLWETPHQTCNMSRWPRRH
jgi:hypothetical protein